MLTKIEYHNRRILTTKQIAEAYGTTPIKIRQNFKNNKGKYEEGKHYFNLQGVVLQTFIERVENFYPISKRAHSFYLWTERGALLHAKSINTDKARDVYEMLLDTYFTVQSAAKTKQKQLQPPQFEAAAYIGSSRAVVRNFLKMDDFTPRVRSGKGTKIDRKAFDEWLARQYNERGY